MKNVVSMMRVVFVSVVLSAALVAGAFAADKPVLAVSDCAKCHAAPPADIAANGGAHKTSISCQDCHGGHRPMVKNNIPQCSQCHSGKAHYNLSNCLRCHNNPHTPKIIKLANNITDECLTCHTSQIVKLKQVKSKHSALACSFCHNVHGKIPLCTQCHKPHSADMVATECKKCHQAHMPTAVFMTPDTPNKMCASCHKRPFEMLSGSDAKHKAVLCVTCHKDKHKTIPSCQSCHGVPHPASMMARFTKCGDCHSVAHKLNHWEAGTLKTVDKTAPIPLPKKPAAKKKQ
jgi:predicted CXXCH cytochrome family protein